MNEPIGVLIVDDFDSVRETLKSLLELSPRLKVKGMAHNGHEAVEQVQRLWPDLVLMDIHMPKKGGIEATQVIKGLPRPPKVIVVSSDDYEAYRKAAAAAGADAFCSKLDITSELVPMIFSLFPEPESPPPTAASSS